MEFHRHNCMPHPVRYNIQEPVLACMAVSHPYRRVLVGGQTLDCFEVRNAEPRDNL